MTFPRPGSIYPPMETRGGVPRATTRYRVDRFRGDTWVAQWWIDDLDTARSLADGLASGSARGARVRVIDRWSDPATTVYAVENPAGKP